MSKLTVGILCGGKSSEHQISLLSASNIFVALNKEKYNIIPIGIDKKGNFFLYKQSKFILNSSDPTKIRLSDNGEPVTFAFGLSRRLIFLQSKKVGPKLDVLFPVLHGAFGEDGTIQSLAEFAGIPYVGPGVLGSAVGMDKDVAKRLLQQAGIPIAEFETIHRKDPVRFASLKKKFGLPFFVKPACAGSSVGVHKVRTEKECTEAFKDAFQYSDKVLVEKAIEGKEIECAVLGNDDPIVSLPGAVIPKKDFYSYQAKYLDDHGADFEIPAHISITVRKKIQRIALETYQALNCSGMARVDGFLQPNENFVINEINTIPGFTSISMYPKLWEVSGLSYPKLIDRLIRLAIEKPHK